MEKREQSIRKEVLHKGFLWSRFFYVVWCYQHVAVGCLWNPSPGFITVDCFCCQLWHLFPSCGHRLRLFRINLRDRALKAQQTVLTRSPASSTRHQMFVCENLYELFSAYINKERTSPSIFLVRIRKIEMAAFEEIKFENMT